MFRIPALLFVFTLFLTTSLYAATNDSGAVITKNMIDTQNARLEEALNNRADAQNMVRILHNQISDDAKFHLTVSNAATGPAEKSQVMEMSKQDYINTYLQGPQYVADYNISIKTKRIEYDPETKQALSFDIITEQGKMMNEFNMGQSFVSLTTCKTQHEMKNNHLVAIAGTCHTDISFEEEI